MRNLVLNYLNYFFLDHNFFFTKCGNIANLLSVRLNISSSYTYNLTKFHGTVVIWKCLHSFTQPYWLKEQVYYLLCILFCGFQKNKTKKRSILVWKYLPIASYSVIDENPVAMAILFKRHKAILWDFVKSAYFVINPKWGVTVIK